MATILISLINVVISFIMLCIMFWMTYNVYTWYRELVYNDEAELLSQPKVVDLVIKHNLNPRLAEERYTCSKCDQSHSCEFYQQCFNLDDACLASAIITE